MKCSYIRKNLIFSAQFTSAIPLGGRKPFQHTNTDHNIQRQLHHHPKLFLSQVKKIHICNKFHIKCDFNRVDVTLRHKSGEISGLLKRKCDQENSILSIFIYRPSI